MENKTADNIYLIDLSYAKTPADVVFELSSVIETDSASNKRVNLKLGSVDLNQSQLLSIKSLINGINSSLVTLSADSEQTKQAALSLGMVIDNGVEIPEPTQYVPMTEHIALEEQVLETEKAQIDDSSDNEQQAYTDRNDTEKEEETEATELKADSYIEEKELEDELNKPVSQTDTEAKEEIKEEIKSGLDTLYENTEVNSVTATAGSIFDSEQKLEKLFEEQEIKQENIPETGISVKIEIPDYEIPEEEYTEEDYAIMEMSTKSYKQTVRSGQVINYDGNVVVIGDCHPGSEIIATGDITVWGVLGGIAHAGAKGNKKARIRALNLNAIQLRIAQYYARRPDSINIMYAGKTNTFTPEEARILKDNIVILRLNDK